MSTGSISAASLSQVFTKGIDDEGDKKLIRSQVTEEELSALDKIDASTPNRNAIHDAAEKGETARLRKLIERRPDLLEVRSGTYGDTPLLIAAGHANEETCKVLVDAGASCNAKESTSGYNAVHIAVIAGNKDVVQLLLNKEKHLANATSNSGERPLHLAADVEMCNVLLAAGAEVNATTFSDKRQAQFNGQTALHKAAAKGHTKVCEVLLNAGAEINAKDRNGITPVVIAQQNSKDETRAFLISRLPPSAFSRLVTSIFCCCLKKRSAKENTHDIAKAALPTKEKAN